MGPRLKQPLRRVDTTSVRILVAFAVLAWTLAPLPLTGAEIYRWVDANGTPHFTDRPEEVPPAFRDQIVGKAAPADVPFNPLDGLSDGLLDGFGGLDILPGEADGTTAGQAPADWETPELSGEMAQQAQAWLKTAGAALMAGVIFVGLVVAGLFVAISALFLRMGCRVVGQERPGFKKAYGIVLVQLLAGALVGPGLVLVAGSGEAKNLSGIVTYQLASFGLGLLVNALVLRGMLTDSFPRALGIAIVTMLIILGVGLTLGIGLAILIPLLVAAAA